MSQFSPLAEVFGFPPDNFSKEAQRIRKNKFCPFHNITAKCNKDKATDPLGVCSVEHGGHAVITCPIRFTEDLLLFEPAAKFFFPESAEWTDLREVRLKDAGGKSAGNIDYVLVSYDQHGRILDFGSLEVQGVYISGNVRIPFSEYMEGQKRGGEFGLSRSSVKPDYLSSSRKRLAPQIMFKGGILKAWRKKQAIAIQSAFFSTLPDLPECPREEADIVWMLFDLLNDEAAGRMHLKLERCIYTRFFEAMEVITVATPGSPEDFTRTLQEKLDEKNASAAPGNEILRIELG